MTAKVWSGVAVAIQSALSAAMPVTAVTKADPGVVTYTGSDLAANSDYIVLTDMVGMYQMDDRIARVANLNSGGNTLELEGIDTTLFDTHTSGNAYVITFGTSLSVATGVTASGGEFEFIDTTTIHGSTRVRIPGVSSPISMAFTCQWDPASTALAALKSASDSKAKRAIRITFADSTKFLFYGYVGFAFIPAGNAQELVTCSVQIEGIGRPTAYAT